MTIRRTIGLAVVAALLSLAIASLGSELFYMHWLRALAAQSHRPPPKASAEELDRGLRASLPAGSSRISVETALRSRHMDYHFDTSRQIVATPSGRKGADSSSQPILAVTFHFDDRDSLTSIDSHFSDAGR